MKHSLMTTQGLNLAFCRGLLPPSAFYVVPVPLGAGSVRLWWGIDVEVTLQEGDLLVVMPTPWGMFFEGVVKPEPANESMGEAA